MSTLQKRNRNRGKATERAVAKIFGGKRVGILGAEDVTHSIFSIECKSVKRFIGEKWMGQANKNNKDGKIPIVVIHITGKHHQNDYVLVKVSDFISLTGGTENVN